MRLFHATAILVLLLIAACSKKAAKLELNLEEGRTYVYHFESDQQIEQEINKMKNSIEQFIGMSFIMNVEKKDESGDLVIRTTYDDIQFKQDAPGGSTVYNSKDTSGGIPELARPFANLLGETFTIIMSPSGKVKEILGYNEMMERIIDKSSRGNDSLKTAIRQQMGKQFSDAGLKESLENSWNIFPPNEVKEGDIWVKSVRSNSGIPIMVSTTYTLTELTDYDAILDIKAEITPVVTKGESFMSMSYDIKGTQQGEIHIVRSTGLIKDGLIKQELKGDIILSSGEKKNAIWPIAMKTTTKMSSEEVD